MIRITPAIQKAGLALLLGLAVATCQDAPMGPGRRHRASLALAPVLPQQALNLAEFGLSIDSLRVVVVRPPSDTAVDQTVVFAVDQDSISLAVNIDLEATSETFDVTLELRGGGFVLFSTSTSVTVVAGGAGTNEPLEVADFVYSGPGAGVTNLVLSPADSVIRLGDSLRFRVAALADGIPVTDFYVSWSTSDETLAPINAHGVLKAPVLRGLVLVTATTPTGATATVPVTFVPVPVSVVPVGPIPQNVLPGVSIGPLRVRVLAADGLGVKGVPVSFQVVSGGGSVKDAVAVTDSAGFAETPATSGTGVLSVYSATVTGVATPALFNVSILANTATQLAFTLPPAGGVVDLPFAAVVEVRDAQGVVVTTATDPVTLALGPLLDAVLGGTLTVNAVNGVALFTDLTINSVGTGFTLVATAPGLTSVTSPPFDIIPGFTGKLWTNAAGGNWSNPANWNGGVVPAASDQVFIALDGTYTVNLDVDATVAYLFVGGGSGTQTLAVANHVLGVDSGAVFSPQSALNLTNATINTSLVGTLSTAGTIAVAPGTSRINGSLFLNTGSLLRLNGDNGPAFLLNDGDLYNLGTVELTGTSWGGQLAVTNGTFYNAPGGTLRTVTGTGNAYTGTFDNGGSVQVDAHWTLAGLSANHTNNGTIVLGSGDWTLDQSGTGPSFTTTGTVTVGVGRTWNVNGGTVDYANATPGGLGGRGTIAFNGTVLNLTPDLTHDTLALRLTNTTVHGPGTLIAMGPTPLLVNSATLNTALLNQGTLQANPGTNLFTGAVTNATGALLRLLGNNGPAVVTVANGLTNQGTIELTGNSWGGQLIGTGGPLVNGPGATLRVLNGAGNSYTGTLENQGAIQVDGPWTLAGAAAHHVNAGSIVLGAGDWTLNQTGTAPTFTTTGTVIVGVGRTWTVSGGAVDYQAGALAGKGLVVLNAVTLGLGVSLTHDTLALSLANTIVNGPGTLTVAAATTLGLSSATLNVALVNQGTLQVNPGTNSFTGAVTNATGALMRLQGNNGPAVVAVASGFTNQGTIELTGNSWGGHLSVTAGALVNAPGATLRVVNGAGNAYTGTLLNQGTVQVDGPWTLAGGSAQHVNSGTIVQGAGDWALNQTGTAPSFTTTGTVTVGVGRVWNVNGGTLTYQTGALGGRGVVVLSGVTLGLGVGLRHDTLALNLANATVNGPGALTVAGPIPLQMSSTTLNAPLVNLGVIQVNPGPSALVGPVTNQSGALLRLFGNNGPAAVTVGNGFTNQGTIDLTGTSWGGNLTVLNGALTNAPGAIFQATAGTGHTYTGTLVNQSLVRLSGASLTVDNTGQTLTGTTGVFDVAAGQTLTLNAGTMVIGSGTALTGTGTISLNNTTLSLASDVTLAANQPTWGFPGNTTINGPGTLTNQVTLLLANDLVNAPLKNEGLLEVPGGAAAQLNGPFTQQGAVRLNGTNGDASLVVGAAFTNEGTIDLTGTSWGGHLSVGGILTNASGATLSILPTAGGTSTLDALVDNQGVVTIAGQLNLNRSLSSSGTVDWSNGSVAMKSGETLDILGRSAFNVTSNGQWNGSSGQALIAIRAEANMKVSTAGATAFGPLLVLDIAGTLDIQSTAALKITGDFNLLDGTGELIGTGTLDVGSSPKVTNFGTVKPGGDVPGILTIVAPSGGWRQGTGSTLVIDIAGTTPGLEYDQLVIQGVAILGGIINVNRTVAGARDTQYVPLTATVDIGGVLLPGNLAALQMILLLPDLGSTPKRVILLQQ